MFVENTFETRCTLWRIKTSPFVVGSQFAKIIIDLISTTYF